MCDGFLSLVALAVNTFHFVENGERKRFGKADGDRKSEFNFKVILLSKYLQSDLQKSTPTPVVLFEGQKPPKGQ